MKIWFRVFSGGAGPGKPGRGIISISGKKAAQAQDMRTRLLKFPVYDLAAAVPDEGTPIIGSLHVSGSPEKTK